MRGVVSFDGDILVELSFSKMCFLLEQKQLLLIMELHLYKTEGTTEKVHNFRRHDIAQ